VRPWSKSSTGGVIAPLIPFIHPSFPEAAELAEDIKDIVQANWYTNFGPKEHEFARALGEYLGPNLHVSHHGERHPGAHRSIRRHDRHRRTGPLPADAVIHLHRRGPGRPSGLGTVRGLSTSTLTPGSRAFASARAVLERSRDRVVGVLLTNAFGVGNPEVGAWEDLAAEWELPIVLDSAAGFGSMYAEGERVGGRGTCEIFSLHATKPFAGRRGWRAGISRPRLVEKAYQFQNFGLDGSRQCTQIGMNGKLPELSAAIGLRQLVGLDRRLASRRNVFDCYRANLEGVGMRFQTNARASSLQCGSACCRSADHKAAVLASLREHAVQARDYYNPPLHLQPYFVSNPELSVSAGLHVTEDVCSRIVSLPIHDYMAAEDVDRIVAGVLGGS